MANFHKLLCVALFFAVITKGYSQCSMQELRVAQSKTGQTVGGKPEWKVTLTNPCKCTVQDVKLSCPGFQSTRPIDGSVMSKSGDECLLNNGNPIYGSTSFSFTYAWDTSFDLKPLYSRIACS